MQVTYELDLNSFNAWCGAISTLDAIKDANKCEEFEQILDELYPNGMTETELNDLLWFDDEWIFEVLDMSEEEEEEDE